MIGNEKLKLKVLKKGTHLVEISKWNNDVPSPCELVAEYLYQLEYDLGQLIKSGGSINNSQALDHVKSSVSMLNTALCDATKQDWQLELEG